MQPSIGTLDSPSSRVVKDSTPSRRRILRYINFGIGESSPILFFGPDESSPNNIWSNVNLERMCILLFYYFLYFKVNLDLEKTNHLGESSPNFIFAVVNLDPFILEKRWIDCESWPNDFVEKVKGEDLRWVGSRCPLTCALSWIHTTVTMYLFIAFSHAHFCFEGHECLSYWSISKPQKQCRSMSWKKFNFKSVSCSRHRIPLVVCMSIFLLKVALSLNGNVAAHHSALKKNASILVWIQPYHPFILHCICPVVSCGATHTHPHLHTHRTTEYCIAEAVPLN